MKKTEVDLDIGTNETMRIEAYVSSTDGLVIHRQVAYVPAKQEHKHTSKWQITHAASGQALLKPSECVSTMAQAEAIAKGLEKDTINWTELTMSSMDVERSRKTLLELLQNYQEEETQEVSVRYIVRRNADGPGYLVMDIETDKVEETFIHRGLASERARELNEGVST